MKTTFKYQTIKLTQKQTEMLLVLVKESLYNDAYRIDLEEELRDAQERLEKALTNW